MTSWKNPEGNKNNKEGRMLLQHAQLIIQREISRESSLTALFKTKYQAVYIYTYINIYIYIYIYT